MKTVITLKRMANTYVWLNGLIRVIITMLFWNMIEKLNGKLQIVVNIFFGLNFRQVRFLKWVVTKGLAHVLCAYTAKSTAKFN